MEGCDGGGGGTLVPLSLQGTGLVMASDGTVPSTSVTFTVDSGAAHMCLAGDAASLIDAWQSSQTMACMTDGSQHPAIECKHVVLRSSRDCVSYIDFAPCPHFGSCC